MDARLAKFSTIISRLKVAYGMPRHGNVRDGFWEFVLILMSIRTSERLYLPAFKRFRRRFRSLDNVANARRRDVERQFKPIGLSRLRGRQIQEVARGIKRDFGARRFNALGKRDHAAFESYLMSFHGVGAKIAKCVSMYAFDAPSFPVDVHVWRVMSRLGYAPGGRISEAKALALEANVPERYRYALHVLCVAHGRKICRSRPLCEQCPLNDLCPSARFT